MALVVGAAALLPACSCSGGKDVPRAMIKREPPPELGKLTQAPFSELSFVPAQAEALLRVDLAALARSGSPAAGGAPGGDTETMLDFLLHAQQPAAWQVLQDAGLRVGRELRAAYLVIVPGGDALVAGVGAIELVRLRDVLARGGAIADEVARGAVMFTWADEEVEKRVGGHMPHGRGLGAVDTAVGVADGLILVGPPQAVRAALLLGVGGKGDDVRRGPLAGELAALDGRAMAWGVARREAKGRSTMDELAPGLTSGRFHLEVAAVGDGAFALRAEFDGEAAAKAFAEKLTTMIGAGALLTKKTPIGAALTRLREAGPIQVDGNVVSIAAAL